MVQLPPSEFTYGKYGRCEIPSWDTIKSTAAYHSWLLNQNIIGYCNSEECEIRPRPNDMAIMFMDDEEQEGWSHIPKDVWQKFMRGRND